MTDKKYCMSLLFIIISYLTGMITIWFSRVNFCGTEVNHYLGAGIFLVIISSYFFGKLSCKK